MFLFAFLFRLSLRLIYGLLITLLLKTALRLCWGVVRLSGRILWALLRALRPKTKGRRRERPIPRRPHTHCLRGRCRVTDGDGLVIGTTKLRLAGIDAPEQNHPWGREAKAALAALCEGKIIRAEYGEERSYDRIVATCYLPDGRDLSAELVRRGLALDWPKYSHGKYAHLEPRGSRKRHWRAAARQKGDMRTFYA